MRKVIGLTGSIATGKSAVTSFLRELGFMVIDADEVVHELQEPGGVLYQAIIEEFGTEFLESSGAINRKKLASLVFCNQSAYECLSDLQDRIIRQELEARRLAELEKSERTFFMDIPLLLEEHYEDLFDEIWLVSVPADIQLQRLMMRSNLTKSEAEARISRQMPLAEKALLADVVLDNSGTLENLKTLVETQVNDL